MVWECNGCTANLFLMEWYSGLHRQGLGADVGGYFTTLGGKILDPKREVSGLGLCGLQEVVFHGRLRCSYGSLILSSVLGVLVGRWRVYFCS